MALLMLFAFIAGAGTALSPCVLPILPAVLSAGVTGGRARPLGVVTGLLFTFTFAVVGLVYVIDALGLPNDLARNVAIGVMIAFGASLLIPPLAARIEAALQRLAPGPARAGGEGFGSGLVLGASLGFVYAPCAGPILAGVITASASQDFTAGKLAIAFAYGLGSAVVLYGVLIGGRRLSDRLTGFRGRVQVAMGALMIAVAGLMIADLDLKFQQAIAEDLPGFLRNPASSLEESGAVADRLASLDGAHEGGAREGGAAELASGEKLPKLGLAPEFYAPGEWFNSEPLSMKGLRAQGSVVLIDFWTYTCINCIRTLPYIRAWDAEYRDDGLVIVGVHTPEFPFEREASNVEQAIDEYEIEYPVVQDNDYGTWNAWGNQYWPAKYLIDANGQVRYVHFGEGEYETTEAAIRSLLAEAGDAKLGEGAEASTDTVSAGVSTPETYLGSARASGWANGAIRTGRSNFGGGAEPVLDLPPSTFLYRGSWEIDADGAEAVSDAAIDASFTARRVFLVLGPGKATGSSEVDVLLDGEPISSADAGEDVTDATAEVSEERLYSLVDLPRSGSHTLTLEFEPGIDGFAFTFG